MARPTTKRKKPKVKALAKRNLIKPNNEASEKGKMNAVTKEEWGRKERKKLMAKMRKKKEREKKNSQ